MKDEEALKAKAIATILRFNLLPGERLIIPGEHMKDEDDDIQVYQRPWVDLEPEDRLCAKYMLDAPEGIEAVIDYITAKLKEKNSG